MAAGAAMNVRVAARSALFTRSARSAFVCAGLAAVLALQGCATARNPDPLESINRRMFSFNDALDENVLKPVATGYRKVTPEPVRTGFTNFVNNIKDVWSTANLFLQGRFADGTLGVVRVSVNSTFGLLGLLDIASEMRIDRPNEDLGQTLGVWGMGPGAYIVWPVLGPSTVRDSIALPADMQFSASAAGDSAREKNVLRLWSGINLRANLLDATNLLSDVALDKYAFVRDAYLQRRQNLIYEGDPPHQDFGSDEDEAGEENGSVYAPAGDGDQDDGSLEGKPGGADQADQAGKPGMPPAAPVRGASSPI